MYKRQACAQGGVKFPESESEIHMFPKHSWGRAEAKFTESEGEVPGGGRGEALNWENRRWSPAPDKSPDAPEEEPQAWTEQGCSYRKDAFGTDTDRGESEQDARRGCNRSLHNLSTFFFNELFSRTDH